jgi:hypothetical protein
MRMPYLVATSVIATCSLAGAACAKDAPTSIPTTEALASMSHDQFAALLAGPALLRTNLQRQPGASPTAAIEPSCPEVRNDGFDANTAAGFMLRLRQILSAIIR